MCNRSNPIYACLVGVGMLFFTCVAPQTSAREVMPSLQSKAVTFRSQPFHIVYIDLEQSKLKLFWNNPDKKTPFSTIDTLRQYGKKHQKMLVFATNAGIYDTRMKPLGLHVEQGKTVIPLNLAHGKASRGNFSLLPNGVFAVTQEGRAMVRTTAVWKALGKSARIATQSGPMLVIDNKINPHFNPKSISLKWRSGVCAPEARKVAFAVSLTPVNFDVFARLFRDKIHCRNALFLDGTLSRMYINKQFYGSPALMHKPLVGIFAVFATKRNSRKASAGD